MTQVNLGSPTGRGSRRPVSRIEPALVKGHGHRDQHHAEQEVPRDEARVEPGEDGQSAKDCLAEHPEQPEGGERDEGRRRGTWRQAATMLRTTTRMTTNVKSRFPNSMNLWKPSD